MRKRTRRVAVREVALSAPRRWAMLSVATLGIGLSSADAGTLFSTRFEEGLLAAPTDYRTSAGDGVTARVAVEREGTIDAYQGERGNAMTLRAGGTGKARLVMPDVAVSNAERELARLTLGSDVWMSDLKFVRVRISSVDAGGNVTGTLGKTVAPPIKGAYYRFTPDLAAFEAEAGRFDPAAPKVRVEFEVEAGAEGGGGEMVLRVDNVSLTGPAYFVSPTGNDSADGRTEATAFASLQHAVDATKPGDTVLVMDGTYVAPDRQELLAVTRRGEPDKWITIRSAPGHKPVLRGTGWNIVVVRHPSAYVELRGLTVRGYNSEIPLAEATADEKIKEKDGKPYHGDPRCNTNGMVVDGRKGDEKGGRAHHIRMIGNTIYETPGGGSGAMSADHLTFEGNHIYDTAHRMRYGGSALGSLRAWNFDADPGHKLFFIGNTVHGNRCYVPWGAIGKISDGNGIIIDDHISYQIKWGATGIPYNARTLVQNNVSFGNGGSGIHAYASDRVDIVNNTAFHNAQSPELMWRQIWAGNKCRDVRLVNNVMWAQSGKPVGVGTGNSSEILYSHNLMFGDGNNGLTEGGGLGTDNSANKADVVKLLLAPPGYVNPTLDWRAADFRLRPDSPAIDAGDPAGPGVPIVDIDGKPRVGAPDLGAYEVGGQ